jgi:HSP20 family protein
MAVPVRHTTSSSPSPTRSGDPFRELEELQARMSRMIQAAWSGPGASEAPWIPLVDIEETDDAWVVEAELPGVRREDVQVEVHDSELAIHGELREPRRVGILRRRARPTGRFDFHVMLPGPADPDKIDAKLEDGVLRLHILKPERARPHRIAIASG